MTATYDNAMCHLKVPQMSMSLNMHTAASVHTSKMRVKVSPVMLDEWLA